MSSSNTFDPTTDIPDLTGKTYLVTGGSTGIGFGICAHLLQHNARILLLSNKEDHAEDALEELREYGDIKLVEWVKCDLADLKATDAVAKQILEQESVLHGMVMNAGLGVGKYWETVDGLDSHFQVNWLSQLHLTLELLPLLKKQPGGRLVFMSSDLHRGAEAETEFKDVAEINTDTGPMKLYNRSKLAQVLGMLAIQRRMQNGGDSVVNATAQDKIYVNATHPGAVVTPQQDQAVEAYGTLGKIGVKATRPFMKDPVKSGCRSALFAATSTEVEDQGITGKYIVPDKKVTEPSDKSQDVELGERLWKLSLQLLDERLGST